MFLPWVRTTRPLSSAVAGALAAAAAMGGQGGFTLRGATAGLTMMALAMFGFCMNDIADFEKDRGAGVRRPVATGELSRVGAAWLAAALVGCAGLLAAATGTGWMAAAVTGAALAAYSPAARRFPLCKDLYVAAVCCGPLYYGALAGGRRCGWISYAVLVCFVLGREVLMDAEEVEGDLRAGMRTVAAWIGTRSAARIGMGLMITAAAALAVTARTAVAVTTLVSLVCVLSGTRRVEWSRFPMLLGTVALAWDGR